MGIGLLEGLEVKRKFALIHIGPLGLADQVIIEIVAYFALAIGHHQAKLVKGIALAGTGKAQHNALGRNDPPQVNRHPPQIRWIV